MSTFRTTSGPTDFKRGYVRVATAVATKSVPPPPPCQSNAAGSRVDAEPAADETASTSASAESPNVEVQMDVSENVAPEDAKVATAATPTPSATPSPPPSISPTPTTSKPAKSSINQWGKDKPPVSYAGLLALVLDDLPGGRGTLQDIYRHITEHFPFYAKSSSIQWQNSIRHNLSLHEEFIRFEKDSGRGGLWTVKPGVKRESLIRIRGKDKDRDSATNSPARRSSSNTPDKVASSPIPPSLTSAAPKVVNIVVSRDSAVFLAPAPPPPQPLPRSPEKKADRPIQSLEEFLEIGANNKQEQVTVLSASEFGSEAPTPNITTTTSMPDVSIPMPPSVGIGGRREQPKPRANSVAVPVVATKSSAGKFVGSMDYWQQYDPDEVSRSGQAVVTTESLPVSSLCFLCGSAGQEEMLYCAACCEPFHPFCLSHDELPQTAEVERDWVCRRCAACQVCGGSHGAGGEKLRCCKCLKASHKECLQPNQRETVGDQENGDDSWVRMLQFCFFFVKIVLSVV